jgi:arylsulfatase A-like enzyme
VQAFSGTADHNLAQYFREAGYHTALIGKAHLPGQWVRDGFEYHRFCDVSDAGPDDPRSIAYFDYLVGQGLADNYDLGALPSEHPGGNMRAFTSALPLAHSVETWTGNEGVRFLQDRDPNRPFFLQLSFQRPHDPYAPSEESLGMYNPADLELPVSAQEIYEKEFQGKPLFQREWVQGRTGGYPYVPQDEADLRRQLAHYYTLISVIDEQIGRVLATLREQGIENDTIVVYHADHGDFAGEHGLMLKNLGIYEAIHRIPFILRYPGGPSGQRQNGMVESVDLFPTLCHLAGLNIPGGLDGKVIAGPDASFSDLIVCEWDWYSEPQSRVAAVRSQTHRLVYYRDAPEDGELYDLVNDPEEVNNLYSQPSVQPLREALTRHLLNHLLSAKRRLGTDHDLAVPQESPSLTRRVFKLHEKWSTVKHLAPPRNE